MIKPAAATFGLIAACCVLLASCGGRSYISEKQNTISDPVRVIHYVSSDLEEQQPRMISEQAREYEKQHPNIKYEFENVNTSDLVQKIQLLAASNDLPEIFSYESGRQLEQLADNGFILDIEKLFREIGLQNELNPAAVKLLKSMVRNKGLYALPLEINIEGFWYNKDMFAKYGLAEPETWDDLLHAAEIFHSNGIQPFALSGAQKWPITRLINGYVIRKYGYDAMQRVERKELKVTEPGFVEAAAIVQHMAQQGYFGKHVNMTEMDEASALFLEGKAAMFYTGSWSLRDFNSSLKNHIGMDAIGLFNIPLVPGGKGTKDDWMMNAGLTTSLSAAAYDDTMKDWLKAVFTGYGDKAMEESGVITGFNVQRLPSDVPKLTQMVQSTIDSVKNGALWFEALFDSDAQTIAWNNAQLLISSKDYTPEMYMQDLQAALDEQQ
ncbi:raffinose/stachyose/melibiose transport system substrate-binding protein [Paenibacillus catalpae]|uniref:Raffinose/stachyose/melibiose transport system substrate-binding protein n=1 Tax=Paenibacillus catalpae TaxID=1045775 RepID=A0A1I1XLU3_9BACL|nr:extracellular solute-binding protein [Paenibacillus catalpae]SFE08379.1 raffinose/stachyose/melibiose transport system substrate-binding protein [Paenibacillus catalpae]